MDYICFRSESFRTIVPCLQIPLRNISESLGLSVDEVGWPDSIGPQFRMLEEVLLNLRTSVPFLQIFLANISGSKNCLLSSKDGVPLLSGLSYTSYPLSTESFGLQEMCVWREGAEQSFSSVMASGFTPAVQRLMKGGRARA